MSVTQVLKDWRDTLSRIPGVTAVGRGRGSNKIVIYVEKLSLKILGAVPPVIEGIPVEVRESGVIKLLSMMPVIPLKTLQSRTGRYRPLVGGISLGCPQVTAGTLGGTAIDKLTGRLVGISNNHVLLGAKWGDQAGYDQNHVLQPGVYDGGSDPGDLVGYTSRATPVELTADNIADACIFDPSAELSRIIEEISLPLSPKTVEPYVGLTVLKSGRTTGLTSGTVTVLDATVNVSGVGTATFVDQVLVEPSIMDGGDSGSLVFTQGGDPVGLGFAGSDKISVFNRASNVNRLLNISLLGAPMGALPGGAPSAGLGEALAGLGLLLLSLV